MDRKQTVSGGDIFYNVRLQLGSVFAKVRTASIAIVGAGGIGSNLALALAGYGVGELIVIDGDTVSERNLPVATIFTRADIGKFKAKVVSDFVIRKYGSRVKVRHYPKYTSDVPLSLLSKPPLMVVGVDDRWSKLALTHIRVKTGKPYIVLGFEEWEANFLLVVPKKTACWACLWRPDEGEKVEELKREGKCPEPDPNVPGAVIPPTVMRLVGLASAQVLKLLMDEDVSKIVQYARFDIMSERQDIRFLNNPLKPDPDCPICQEVSEVDVADFGFS